MKEHTASSRGMLLSSWLCLVLLLSPSNATVPCRNDIMCEQRVAVGSKCSGGVCTNPFTDGGCLARKLVDRDEEKYSKWKNKIRTCGSDDSEASRNSGYCLPVAKELEYTETRILTQNWEGAYFQAWILQILLSEMLGVPTSLETGTETAKLDFYASTMPVEYGTANNFDALRLGNELGDCTLANQVVMVDNEGETSVVAANDEEERKLRRSEGGPYRPCANVAPEIWMAGKVETMRTMEEDGVITPVHSMGAIGMLAWFMPKFTAEFEPSLLQYSGLQGEHNREKLAAIFKRPSTWKEYCEQVSANNCTTPDEVAQRAPQERSEEVLYFQDGLYTGHFQATEKNNCTANPATCTGHAVTFPCGWASNMDQVIHHYGMAFETDGPEDKSGGYSYSQLIDVWAAANATKSHVVMQWWIPEALYNVYLGTDAEFQVVGLPPATQACMEARVATNDRCSDNLEERVGTKEGACGDPPEVLARAMTTELQSRSDDPEVTPAKWSPAYDAIKAFQITELQVGELLENWLSKNTDKYGFDPRDAACNWVVENIDYMETLIPATFPRVVQPSEPVVKAPLFTVALLMSCVSMAVVAVSILLTLRRRTSSVMVRAQVEFLYILLLGLAMVTVGSAVQIIPPSNGTCMGAAWFINLGYSLILVPLIVKMAAINRIVSAVSRMKRVVLRLEHLFGVVAGVTFMVIVMLTVWTAADPIRQVDDFDITDSVTDDGFTIVRTTSLCSSKTGVGSYASLGWHVVLLLCATVLAFQTRKIPQDVNETHVLATMIYSQFVFIVMRTIFNTLTEVLSPEQAPLYLSLIASCDATATCLIYFLPKFGRTDAQNTSDVMASSSIAWESQYHQAHQKQQQDNPYASRVLADVKGASTMQQRASIFLPPEGYKADRGVSRVSRISASAFSTKLKGALSEIGYDVDSNASGQISSAISLTLSEEQEEVVVNNDTSSFSSPEDEAAEFAIDDDDEDDDEKKDSDNKSSDTVVTGVTSDGSTEESEEVQEQQASTQAQDAPLSRMSIGASSRTDSTAEGEPYFL